MTFGVNIVVDANGEIVEENKVIIENDHATTLCKERRYVFNWDIQGRNE